MGKLEPKIAEQLKTFNQTIVLPVFEQIKEVVEPLGYQVWTTDTKTTGNDPFDELLYGLSEGHRIGFLADIDPDPDSANSLWKQYRYLVSALMVQLPGEMLAPQHPYENKFCFGIQCNISKEETISATVLTVLYTKREETFERFQYWLNPDQQDQPIATLTQAHVLQQFLDSFAGFRTQALEELEPKPEPIPEPAQATIAITVADIPSPPPATLVTQATPNDLAQQKEAIAQKEVLQRKEVSQFLMPLNVRGSLWLNELHGRDLERLVAWSRAMQTVPVNTYEYRKAHSALRSQAAHYAMLLDGISPMMFANLFELYCSAVHRLCDSLTDPGADAAQVFIEQVKIFAEPKPTPRGQHLIEYNGMCSMYRNIAQKFGKPDEYLQRQWIGESYIKICINESMEPKSAIPKIQACSQERQVRFRELSWAVLQVYQNQDLLLTNEPSPGRNAVERFLYSAWLTIQKPMREVRYIRHQADEIEFIFERSLFNSGRWRTARARVIVSGGSGWTFLHSYGFEET
jgi:hypothetical protein